jgi:outer membrane protein insertion porin family
LTALRRTRIACVAGVLALLAAPATLPAQQARCTEADTTIRRLRFTGNAAFPATDLERAIVTTPSSWARRSLNLPLGTRRCIDSDELPKDRLRLMLLYRTRGYPDAAVDVRVVRVRPRVADVEFRIVEGEPIILRELVVTGLEQISRGSEFARRLPIRAGEPVDRVRLEAARDTILRRLRNAGYPHADARHILVEDRVSRTAVDTITVIPGSFSRIGSVAVDATPLPGRAQQISDSDVRRIAGVREGDVYREEQLLDAQRALYLTDAFRQVSVRVDTSGVADSTMDVTLVVAEDAMRAARLGGGYGTLDCFRASGELTHYNFGAGARRLELTSRVSKIGIGHPLGGAGQLCPQARDDPYSSRLNYYTGVTLRQPGLFGAGTLPTLTVFSARTSEFKAYLRTTTVGGIASLETRRTRTIPVTFAYQLDFGRTEAQPALFCAVFNRCDREEQQRLQTTQRLGTFSITASRNSSDDALFPRRGGTWRVEARHASRATLADSGLQFSKLVGDMARYWPVWSGVFAVRLRAGGVFSPSFGEIRSFIPPEERLFAGGPTTVRGFPQNELGSAIYVAAQFDTVFFGADTLFRVADTTRSYLRAVPVGGNSLVVANFEWRVRSPILSDLLQLTLFTDVGDVWNRGSSDVFRNLRLKTTPGIQLGGTSPVGLIRMVVGYNPYDRPRGPLYYEQSAAEGGGLPCVSPVNLLPVHTVETVSGPTLVQMEGRCPGTFQPQRAGGFRNRLTFSFAIGQAF